MSALMDPISLLINGRTHQEWETYRIDSDLLSPADDWNMSASFSSESAQDNTLPEFVFEGATARLMLGDDVLLDGLVDSVDHMVDKHSHNFELSGRDRASLLLDCSAPILSLQMATLEQIINKAVIPLGITNIEYRAKPAAPRQKVHTEPGQSVWEWLHSACEANQVWPWFTPDGKLVIGAPDYTSSPVADLILRFSGEGNNVKSIQRSQSIYQSFSEVTVLGQSAGSGDVGHNNMKGVAKDESMPIYRPRTVIDGNCESIDLAIHRANKIMADSRMSRDKLSIKVDGHRVATSNGTGSPWAPGMRVHVLSEPHRIDAVYFLIRRTFTRSRSAGPATDLSLIPDGTWLLNLPFVKDKRKSDYGKKKGRYAVGNN
jgi:prophage tail gpP-like protein